MKWDWDKFYDKAYNWLITSGPKIILALIILFIGIWLIRMANRVIKNSMKRRNFNPTLRYFLQNLIAIALQILLILLVMQVAGIQLTFFTAIVAGLSVAAGLALSGTLQNFVSGIMILMMKPYKVGDNIIVQSQEGTVSSVQLFYTTVLTYDNKTITVPNGQLSNNIVVNLTKEGKRRLDIELKFSYAIDNEELKRILLLAISETDYVLKDIAPRIGIAGFEADKYILTINMWLNSHDFIDRKLDMQDKILRVLRNSGIKLPGMS
jgi:small conductance mechanosensitive channel